MASAPKPRFSRQIPLPDKKPADDIHLEDLHIDDQYYKEGVRVVLLPAGLDGENIAISAESLRGIALRHRHHDETEKSSPSLSTAETVRVAAITQTHLDIKFSLHASKIDSAPTSCSIYYDPLSDDLILQNTCGVTIKISAISKPQNEDADFNYKRLGPKESIALRPRSWRLALGDTELVDFKILPRESPVILESSNKDLENAASSTNPSLKRMRSSLQETDQALTASQKPSAPQRQKVYQSKENALQSPLLLPPQFPLSGLAATHPLSLLENQTVSVPGVADLEPYQLTKRTHIAYTAVSEVYLARHSKLGDVIAVKIIRPLSSGFSTRRAESWLREYTNQNHMKHTAIVKLYGADARYLTLYFEYIPGSDLTTVGTWRDSNDYFKGEKDDAFAIWTDIAGAVRYTHEKGVEHNDIKPANIMFSKERGAVLCDFGLATVTGSPSVGRGGTPFYTPPEFLRHKVRGKPADVWAFGVTMLYVLGYIQLPDATHREGSAKYWQIAEVHKPNPSEQLPGQPSANQNMKSWIDKILNIRDSIKDEDDPEYILRDMLELSHRRRVSADELVKRLVSLAIRTAREPKRKSRPAKPASVPVPPSDREKSPGHLTTTEEATSTSPSLASD